MSDKQTKFAEWLIDLTPEKMTKLLELEKQARLLSHVKDLMGEYDEKIAAKVVAASKELSNDYTATV